MTVCVLCITVEGLDYGDHTVRVRAARAEGDAAEARAMPERGGLQLPFYRGPPPPCPSRPVGAAPRPSPSAATAHVAPHAHRAQLPAAAGAEPEAWQG